MTTETEVPVEAMEVTPSEPVKEPVKISFGVKKKLDSLVIKTESKSVAAMDVAEGSDEDLEEEERAAKRRKLTHFEDGFMPEDDEDKKGKASVVIPMVMEVDWRVQKLLEQEKDGSITEADRARLELLVESNPTLSEQRKKEQGENTEDAIVVETSKVDTEDADYNQVSIESFGLAILRGCGWKDGEGIGKNPQKVAMRLLERRPKGLGLGATPKTVNKKNANGDKEDEVSQDIKTGSLIKITQGMNKGAYAKVDSRDDDNSSLVSRLALGGRVVRVSLFACYAVSQKEFDKEGKVLNRDEYDKEKRRIEKEKEKYEERRRDGEGERRKEKKRDRDERDYERKKEDDTEMWVRVDCRVRMISEDYKKGKYMDQKMRVVDVADRKNITLEDDTGKTHYSIRQSWLETVMPRNTGEKVIILRGRNRGAKGVMVEKDREREALQVSLIPTHEVIKVRFDDACMWTPQVIDIDDDDC
ncbi:hypothetical protein PMAYCL1PPCAC_18942 [Pristionchus mayeri]|uniref:G-patch domain-containing protein n=1 Tax=Pristionchus mayeri TaxID=1317129 RepID=A0AAN5I1S3_9BILA|nr:hypothetical protein PMAYCL1PPCAC_18942 [Pristionchus mayeri]